MRAEINQADLGNFRKISKSYGQIALLDNKATTLVSTTSKEAANIAAGQ